MEDDKRTQQETHLERFDPVNNLLGAARLDQELLALQPDADDVLLLNVVGGQTTFSVLERVALDELVLTVEGQVGGDRFLGAVATADGRGPRDVNNAFT